MMRVYLDVCCLNRPFDDQRQERVRLETEALLIVFDRCKSGQWQWLSSDQVNLEVGRTSDPERLERLRLTVSNATEFVSLQPRHFERASELIALGFRPADALHVACAEAGSADVFLTTDDQLLRRGLRASAHMSVRIANPLDWVAEVVER